MIEAGLDDVQGIDEKFLALFDRYLCPDDPKSIEFEHSTIGNPTNLLIKIKECPEAELMGTDNCLASKNLGIPSHRLMTFRYNLLTQKYGEEMVGSKFSNIPIARNKFSIHLITKNIVESEESLLGLGLTKPNVKEWF